MKSAATKKHKRPTKKVVKRTVKKAAPVLALVKHDPHKQSAVQRFRLTQDDITTLQQAGIIPEGTPEPMVKFFAQFCNQSGLSPFMRQVYLVKRGGKEGVKFTIQTGIDGFRAIANRSQAYAGSDDATFDREENPLRATVTVYKIVHGQRCAFTATARMIEYKPTQENMQFMWNTKPHIMLSKVAEALALRKAFSQLSGVYSDEEMAKADEETEPAVQHIETAPGVSHDVFDPAKEKFPYGQHIGELWSTLPADFLVWVTKQSNKKNGHKAQATLTWQQTMKASQPPAPDVFGTTFNKPVDAQFTDTTAAPTDPFKADSAKKAEKFIASITNAPTVQAIELLTKQVEKMSGAGELTAEDRRRLLDKLDERFSAIKGTKK